MWRWRLTVLLLFVHWNIILSRPNTEENENNRQVRRVDFIECCPCPGSITGRASGATDSNDAPQESVSHMIIHSRCLDSCPCPKDDSDASSSVVVPNVLRADQPRITESGDEFKPILRPEVDLASSVLETIREATDEEYRDALERESARSAVRAMESTLPSLRDTAAESTRNTFTVIMNPKHSPDKADGITEALNDQSEQNIKSNNFGLLKMTQRVSSNFSQNGDDNNNVSHSNVQQKVKNNMVTGLNWIPIVPLTRNAHALQENSLQVLKNKLIDKNKDETEFRFDNLRKHFPSWQSEFRRDDAQGNIEEPNKKFKKIPKTLKSLMFTDKGLTIKEEPQILKNIFKLKDVELISPRSIIEQAKQKTKTNLLNRDIIGTNILSHLQESDRLSNPMNNDNNCIGEVKNSESNTNTPIIPKLKTEIIETIPSASVMHPVVAVNEVNGNSDTFHVNTNSCESESLQNTDKTEDTNEISDFHELSFVTNEDEKSIISDQETIENDRSCNGHDTLSDIGTEPFSEELNEKDSVAETNNNDFQIQEDALDAFDLTPEDNEYEIKREENCDEEDQTNELMRRTFSNPEDQIDKPLLNVKKKLSKKTKRINKDTGKHRRIINNEDFDPNCQVEEVKFMTTSKISVPDDEHQMSSRELQQMSDSILNSSIKKGKKVHISHNDNCKTNLNDSHIFRSDEDEMKNTEPVATDIMSQEARNIGTDNTEMTSSEECSPSNNRQSNENTKKKDIVNDINVNLNRDRNRESGNCPSEFSENSPKQKLQTARKLNYKNNVKSNLNEMTAEASEPVVKTLPRSFSKSILGSPLRQNPIVQPLPLIPGLDLNLFKGPISDLSNIFNLNTELPTIDDISSRISSILGNSERSTEEKESDEIDCDDDNSNISPFMSNAASTSNFRSTLPAINPVKDINLDIFQLKPLAKLSTNPLLPKIPEINLNSYKTKLELPKPLDLIPLKLESALGNNAGMLGAKLTLGSDKVGLPFPLNSNPILKPNKVVMKIPTLDDLKVSQTENRAKNIQQALQSTLKDTKLKNNDVSNDILTHSKSLLQIVSRTRDDVNAKLQALHSDLNDQLSSIHKTIIRQAKLPSFTLPTKEDNKNKRIKSQFSSPMEQMKMKKSKIPLVPRVPVSKTFEVPELEITSTKQSGRKIKPRHLVGIKSLPSIATESIKTSQNVKIPILRKRFKPYGDNEFKILFSTPPTSTTSSVVKVGPNLAPKYNFGENSNILKRTKFPTLKLKKRSIQIEQKLKSTNDSKDAPSELAHTVIPVPINSFSRQSSENMKSEDDMLLKTDEARPIFSLYNKTSETNFHYNLTSENTTEGPTNHDDKVAISTSKVSSRDVRQTLHFPIRSTVHEVPTRHTSRSSGWPTRFINDEESPFIRSESIVPPSFGINPTPMTAFRSRSKPSILNQPLKTNDPDIPIFRKWNNPSIRHDSAFDISEPSSRYVSRLHSAPRPKFMNGPVLSRFGTDSNIRGSTNWRTICENDSFRNRPISFESRMTAGDSKRFSSKLTPTRNQGPTRFQPKEKSSTMESHLYGSDLNLRLFTDRILTSSRSQPRPSPLNQTFYKTGSSITPTRDISNIKTTTMSENTVKSSVSESSLRNVENIQSFASPSMVSNPVSFSSETKLTPGRTINPSVSESSSRHVENIRSFARPRIVSNPVSFSSETKFKSSSDSNVGSSKTQSRIPTISTFSSTERSVNMRSRSRPSFFKQSTNNIAINVSPNENISSSDKLNTESISRAHGLMSVDGFRSSPPLFNHASDNNDANIVSIGNVPKSKVLPVNVSSFNGSNDLFSPLDSGSNFTDSNARDASNTESSRTPTTVNIELMSMTERTLFNVTSENNALNDSLPLINQIYSSSDSNSKDALKPEPSTTTDLYDDIIESSLTEPFSKYDDTVRTLVKPKIGESPVSVNFEVKMKSMVDPDTSSGEVHSRVSAISSFPSAERAANIRSMSMTQTLTSSSGLESKPLQQNQETNDNGSNMSPNSDISKHKLPTTYDSNTATSFSESQVKPASNAADSNSALTKNNGVITSTSNGESGRTFKPKNSDSPVSVNFHLKLKSKVDSDATSSEMHSRMSTISRSSITGKPANIRSMSMTQRLAPLGTKQLKPSLFNQATNDNDSKVSSTGNVNSQQPTGSEPSSGNIGKTQLLSESRFIDSSVPSNFEQKSNFMSDADTWLSKKQFRTFDESEFSSAERTANTESTSTTETPLLNVESDNSTPNNAQSSMNTVSNFKDLNKDASKPELSTTTDLHDVTIASLASEPFSKYDDTVRTLVKPKTGESPVSVNFEVKMKSMVDPDTSSGEVHSRVSAVSSFPSAERAANIRSMSMTQKFASSSRSGLKPLPLNQASGSNSLTSSSSNIFKLKPHTTHDSTIATSLNESQENLTSNIDDSNSEDASKPKVSLIHNGVIASSVSKTSSSDDKSRQNLTKPKNSDRPVSVNFHLKLKSKVDSDATSSEMHSRMSTISRSPIAGRPVNIRSMSMTQRLAPLGTKQLKPSLSNQATNDNDSKVSSTGNVNSQQPTGSEPSSGNIGKTQLLSESRFIDSSVPSNFEQKSNFMSGADTWLSKKQFRTFDESEFSSAERTANTESTSTTETPLLNVESDNSTPNNEQSSMNTVSNFKDLNKDASKPEPSTTTDLHDDTIASLASEPFSKYDDTVRTLVKPKTGESPVSVNFEVKMKSMVDPDTSSGEVHSRVSAVSSFPSAERAANIRSMSMTQKFASSGRSGLKPLLSNQETDIKDLNISTSNDISKHESPTTHEANIATSFSESQVNPASNVSDSNSALTLNDGVIASSVSKISSSDIDSGRTLTKPKNSDKPVSVNFHLKLKSKVDTDATSSEMQSRMSTISRFPIAGRPANIRSMSMTQRLASPGKKGSKLPLSNQATNDSDSNVSQTDNVSNLKKPSIHADIVAASGSESSSRDTESHRFV